MPTASPREPSDSHALSHPRSSENSGDLVVSPALSFQSGCFPISFPHATTIFVTPLLGRPLALSGAVASYRNGNEEDVDDAGEEEEDDGDSCRAHSCSQAKHSDGDGGLPRASISKAGGIRNSGSSPPHDLILICNSE
uniref:Uncharacterized protein n=1 Tax=Oryza sativa subsp. japonica TaxID=39947 RepID=Q6ZB39_ORYSJ|nr:hypothetical protein [Oryza sativa Japonica Group]BAD15624.1 hypothetical protein [Oryza sativa Japonica Group]